jgi:hypothetical protein
MKKTRSRKSRDTVPLRNILVNMVSFPKRPVQFSVYENKNLIFIGETSLLRRYYGKMRFGTNCIVNVSKPFL